MTDEARIGCITRFVDGPCGSPPTSGLPICGSCLRIVLDEPDPRRRRTLAGNPGLASGVVQQLAEDPDDQVRAQVAARSDLDTATTNRLANPDRESAPIVWRSMAATSGGASHAWELLGTDDPTTLAILAANPSVDPDILDQLARYPDPDVSWTASATLAGQPPGDHIADRVTEARSFDGLPLGDPARSLSRPGAAFSTDASGAVATDAEPPVGDAPPPPLTGSPYPPSSSASGTGGPGAPGALPPRPLPDEPGDHGRRRGFALLVGAGALVVIAAVVLVVAFTGSGSDSRTATVGPSPSTSHTMASTSRPPPTSGANTSTTTTSSSTSTTSTTTTTVPPTTEPKPTAPPPTPAPAVTPPPIGPISQNFTIRSDAGRFCKAVSVTVNFSPAPAYVTITDDTGARVGGWSGASGQTKELQLPRSTSALNVNVTAVGTSISVSGSAAGDSC